MDILEKKKLSINEQIKDLEEKGVTFNEFSSVNVRKVIMLYGIS